jgi:Subtilase family
MSARRAIAIAGVAAIHLIGVLGHPAVTRAEGDTPLGTNAVTVGAAAERVPSRPPADPPAPEVDLDARFDTATVDVALEPFPPASGRRDLGPTTGEQVATTNAAAWHAAGITGAGVRVGVIDYFDVARFWNVAEHGPTPIAEVTARCFEFGANCTAKYFDTVTEAGDDHGVAVVEIVKDMAPEAEIFLGTARTLNDYRLLIDWFAAQGVTVLSRSLSSGYDGPGDGRSALNDIAAYANSRGITWVNSAGNAGRLRYYRHPVRLVGNRVAFGPAGSITFLPFNGCAALNGVRWATDWDLPPTQRTDYDLYLWDAPRGNPTDPSRRQVATSTGDQRAGAVPIEFFPNDYCPSSSLRALYLEVRWVAGDAGNDVIEILDADQGLGAFTQADYSASASIADSRLDGVLAVGAVDPPSSGAVAAYSSNGPTNDERLSPDVSAGAGMYSSVYRQGFSGTSASAPVVAGGAALLLSAGLAGDPSSLGNLVRHLTVDRGAPGPDQQYGHGEFTLPAPPATLDARPSTYISNAPVRVLDTRASSPAGPPNLLGDVTAGELLDLPLGGVVPAGTTAVAVNITAVDVDRPAFVQALPTLAARLGGFSNLNLDAAGQTRSNFAIVPVGAGGSISLYSTGAGHLLVDLLGTFVPAGDAATAGRFVPLSVPERVLDTRPGGVPLRSGTVAAVPWPASIDRTATAALVLTVTGTAASNVGWLQAYPADSPTVAGSTSTVNLAAGASVANTAIVPVGLTGVNVLAFVAGDGTTDVVVDVIGAITTDQATPGPAGRYVPVAPGRAFDSRSGTGDLAAGAAVTVDANAVPGVAVPPGATGVMWNLVPLNPLRPGFGRVHAAGTPTPASSSFNWSAPNEIRATAVVSAVVDGRATVSLDDGAAAPGAPLGGVLADVLGYFT